MIKKEFANIFHSKSIMVLLVAIILIPFAYSFCFLTSAWDPYGNTGKVPIAVVNNDVPTTLQGKKVNVGEQTVAKLRKDTQLGWHIVSAKQAAKGLKENKYYTVITIPKNFSHNAATVLNTHPRQMKLTYKTNGSLNYISEVMSQVGADKLNSQIRASVTNAFASTLFDQVGSIGKQIGTAATGATQISDGMVTLDNGLNKYTVGVGQVNDGVQTMKVSVKPLSSGVQQLADGGTQLKSGTSQLRDGLGQLQSNVPTLSSGVQQLADGGTQLKGGTSQLRSGLSELQSNIPTLSSGVGQLDDGSSQIKAGLAEINSEINGTGDSDLTAGVQQLTDGMNQLNQSVNFGSGSDPSMVEGIEQLYEGISKLQEQTLGNNDSSNIKEWSLTKGVSYANEKMDKLYNKIQKQVSALSQATGLLKANVKGAKMNQDSANEKMEAAIAAVTDPDQKAALEESWTKVTTAQTKTQNVLDNGQELTNKDADNPLAAMSRISAMSVLNLVSYNMNTTDVDAAGDPLGLTAAVDQFSENFAYMDEKLSPTEPTTDNPGFDSAISQIKEGLKTFYDSRKTLADGVQDLTDGLTTLNKKAPKLSKGIAQLLDGSGQLNDGLDQLNSQVPTLASGVNQLADGSVQLDDGTSQLSTGLNQLNSQVPTLASGVNQLSDGSVQLDDGATQLSDGLNQLNSQVPTLMSGVNQLADGTQQLADNSDQLTSGTKRLKSGDKQLATGLTDGYKQINDVKLTKATAKMFAEPSKDVQKKMTTVPNYGAALAPYVLALALFIAIIIFNFTYPMRRRDGYKTVADWLKAKLAVGTLVALAMAVIEATLILAVGLPVDHVAQFYGMTILFSLSAMYLTQMLNLAFGGVGIFIALGLLTLSGSGGLFPAETISPLYESTQKFLPMTYAINGFRNAITSGINSATVAGSVVILIAIAVISLALMFPAVKHLIAKDDSISD